MRFWLRDSERKPDPEPMRTDDRTPVLIGTALWLVALVGVFVWPGDDLVAGTLWTIVSGVVIGGVLIVYTQLKRR